MIGSRVSHFRLLGRLNGEGVGVYRAEDLSAGGPVLLHFITPETGDAAAVERFRQAALDAASLGHPNIAAVREIGTADDGRLYLALPSTDGQTLESLLARGPMPPRSAVDLAAQIAAGLARAHAASIAHGDLRPSCILVTTWSEIKVAAFGLGELAVPGSGEEGAAAYRAPEMLQGGKGGPAADVWSLGVMLYEMIAGRHPFAGALSGAPDDEAELVAAILASEPAPLPVPRGGLPRGLERIVLKTLARRPEDRYPDARPLEIALLRAFAAGATPDMTATRAEIPAAAGHRSPAISLTGTPVGIGVGGVGAGAGPTPTPRGLAGRKLQSYRIFEQLGSGAMSVVYRAEDSRLERSVALKFLAPELSRDPEAKARFLREARAASSLDHPNLCTIHEIEETEDGQIFIAMPYYGGETLAQRIARGPLPLDEMLDIALQVARGLAKAHRHGIVHRDIKPPNLMLTPDGVVKIVDFGLAKLADSSGPRTGSGGGTVAYVSPEQARGEAVDARTDLWSLGVVLYEMAAGRRPFQGDNEQAVLYAVLRNEPRPLPELRPDTPPELARIVRRLLAKDRDERYAAAEGVAADLRALRGPESLGSRSVVTFPHDSRIRGPLRRRGAALGTAAAAAALLLLAGWLWRRTAHVEGPVTASYAVIADQPGRETFPSLAPDGEALVYALEKGGSSDIYWQRVEGSNAIDLTADYPGVDTQPAISPDGNRIVFRSDRAGGGLFVMGLTGESVRRVAEAGYNPSWSPDGRSIVYASESIASPGGRGAVSQLWRIDVDADGPPRPVPTGGDAVQPSWSPHNLRIAYWGIPAGTSRRVLWTVPVDGVAADVPVPVVDDGSLNWSPAWSPDGDYLYFASDRSGSMSLWRVPIDERTGTVRGAPQAIPAPVSSGILPSLSRDGRHVAFAAGSRTANLFLAAFDPVQRQIAGALEQVTRGSRLVRSGEISPDGHAIAFDTAEPQEDLFLVRPDGTGLRALTNDPARDRDPRWSPDGKRILFYSDRSGRWEAWIVHVADGALEPVQDGGSEAVFDPLWSPDGQSLVYGRGSHGVVDLVLLDLRPPAAGRKARPLPVTGQEAARFAATSWSHDGNWLAGFDERGQIVLYSFATQRYEVLREHGEEVCWLRDGRSLLFLRSGALWLLDRPTGETRKLLDPPNGYLFSRLSVGPNDRTLTLVEEPSEGFIGMLTLR
ncbi:MAG TPA: protein kinase [Thermoanaerobaculia bacterium]|nr:protein kinase [Thermoanaerobaculia bacterium]